MTDDPITLAEACALFPRAKVTVSTLRAAADRGDLDIFRLGRRYHTTASAMREWVERCQDEGRRRGSTSIRGEDSGSSATDRASSAQAALNQTVIALRSSLRATSDKSTNRRAGRTR